MPDDNLNQAADQGAALDPNASQPSANKLPDTALTGPDDQPGDKPADQQTDPADKKADPKAAQEQADTKPDKPEGYALSFAEGVQVDTDLLGQFQKAAHEAGLTTGQAQKVADLYAGHAAGLARKFEEAQFQALNDYIMAQNAELAKRPAFKEELVLAKKTLKEFGSEELHTVLSETALGSHPALFEFMVKVGKALGEPGFKGGAGRSPEPPLQDRVWGSDGLGSASK